MNNGTFDSAKTFRMNDIAYDPETGDMFTSTENYSYSSQPSRVDQLKASNQTITTIAGGLEHGIETMPADRTDFVPFFLEHTTP